MTDEEPDWAIDVVREPDRSVLLVAGDLDLETAPRLLAAAEPLLSAGSGALVVDLRKVAFIDSSGLSALIRLNQRLIEAARPFQIVSPPPIVGKVFEITGLNRVLPLTQAPG